MPINAHLHMQAVVLHPGHDDQFLLVRIQVNCEECGEHDLVLSGHHLKPVMALLQRIVDDVDPALVESGEQHQTVSRSTHPVSDPRNN